MIVSHDGNKFVIASNGLVIRDKYRGRGEARMRDLLEQKAALAAGFVNHETGDADVIAFRNAAHTRDERAGG